MIKLRDIPENIDDKQRDIIEEHNRVMSSLKQLVKAMLELSEQPEKVEKLGNNAFKRTKELYERTVMLENQRKDYENLIGND